MQRLPVWRRHFKVYLPLYPFAVRSFDLRGYDLVISSSSAWGKGARVPSGAVHVCYCYTPMRWAWSFDNYVGRSELGPVARLAARLVMGPLRRWDVRTAAGVHRFIAISTDVARRIREVYGRGSDVVFPPVDVDRFEADRVPEEFFLVVSRLNSYKRIDLAVEACSALGVPLVVVGDGPDREKLERMAGPSVRFVGRLSDAAVAALFERCRAFILPGMEDFGLTPLEANAAGRPVVAFAAGGVLDTVRDGETGCLFHEQTAYALGRAVMAVSARSWDPAALRAHAESFAEPVFVSRLRAAVDAAVNRHRAGEHPPADEIARSPH
jgi:glycosyltransferase involved in cell wall biosynthesis